MLRRIVVGTLLSATMLMLFDKLHYTWAVLTICFLFPDHWLLSEEVQHWVIWAAEQNCTNSSNFTYYTRPLCGLLPQWAIIVELQFFRRGHCKLLLLSLFSSWKHTSFMNATCPEYSIFYFKLITCILSSSTEVCISPILLEWIPWPVAHM